MTTYMIVNSDGNEITNGLQSPEVSDEARQIAQRIADDRHESVWLCRSDGVESDDDEEFEPLGRLIAATADLLAALELAKATVERLTPDPNKRAACQGTLDVVHAAITKAKGDRR